MTEQRYRTFFRDQSIIIENTFKSFGIEVMITEINREKDYIEYCVTIAVGTSLNDIEKHSKDLAIALASSTGKVKIVAPIPGKSFVGIQVPHPTKEMIKGMLEKKESERPTFRRKFSNLFMYIGALFFMISEKISKK